MSPNSTADQAASTSPTPPFVERWGKRLFENGNDLKVVANFNKEAGLQKLEDEANANVSDPALKVCYSMYAKLCRGVGAVEAVRNHLDSGVLAKMAAAQIKAYYNPTKMSEHTCQGYTCVIFAACAMSLGCKTYLNLKGYHMFFNTYNKFFLGICSTAPITDEACCQIFHAAMNSEATPSSAGESFTPGLPYDFGSMTRREARAEKLSSGLSEAQASPCWIEPHGMLAIGEKNSLRGPTIPSIIGPCGKADMGYTEDAECCGNERCGKAGAKLRCGRCRDQLYCNKTCQSKDWARHKVVCRTPEMRKDIDDKPQKWTNIFDMLPGRM
ncbi:hypothetical protein CB0940_08063 [Cercospora beticola]|uniref:MYND-type domain-containing protein n=1 Tax=Cercospora beticola TaxID=122368 RepID=A0A2G5HPC6_CERBT|nr:hypothetical protein CB0940_08063 [Cercospora beticola]PIA94113.1 hypothetical protein CB0940_08063 [Cercospora beticola]WPB04621.1 hypothetical protein RHO25_009267 [Cercospora beticola]